MDFQFAPWERLTAAVADGAADARIEIDGRVWLIKFCGELLWVRQYNNSADPICYLIAEDSAPYEGSRFDALRRYLSKAYFSTFAHRIWSFESENCIFAAYRLDAQWCLYKNIEDFDCLGAPFRFPPPDLVPSALTYGALQNSLRDADSDLNYSAHFLALSELDRALLGVRTQIGTPHEWAALVAATARVCSVHWPDCMEFVRFNFCANGQQLRFTLAQNPVLGIRERAILGHIMRIFQPQQIADDSAFPTALRTRTEGGWSRNFAIEVGRSSRHEQIEAALELRAWLQTHWPDGVKHLGKIV